MTFLAQGIDLGAFGSGLALGGLVIVIVWANLIGFMLFRRLMMDAA